MTIMNEEMRLFNDASAAIISKGRELAAALPAQTVQVWPGGATFTSIQAAINSITNAGPQLQYQVAVGAGTYNEYVTMKDYVYIIGSGATNTRVSAAGQQNAGSGVINSAGGCGIAELTVSAEGGSWGTWPIGVKLCGLGKFHISGVTILSSDGGNGGNNVRGITNNTGGGGGQVIISQSVIRVSGESQTTAECIEGFGIYNGGLSLFLNLCALEANAAMGYGVTLAVNASAILDDSKITAPVFALYNSDGTSPIVANQCAVNGPVSSGVVINP